MKTINNVLLTLLTEIDTVCRENGLHYFLTGQTALEAYRSGQFETSSKVVDILMTLPDIKELIAVIEAQGKADRAFESLYNNDHFREFQFRYVATDTLNLSLHSDLTSEKPGIYIRIRALKVDVHTPLSKAMTLQKKAWRFYYRDYPNTSRISGEKKIGKRMSNFWVGHTHDGYRKRMIRGIEKTQKNVSLDDELYIRGLRRNRPIIFPQGLFAESQEVELEGHKFFIPKDAELFFEVLYGENWTERTFKPSEVTQNRIVDANFPYAEYFAYLKANGLTTDISEELAAENKARAELKPLDKRLTRNWRIVQRTGARFNLWKQYVPQKAYIQDLYENEKWEELGEVLADYDIAARKYRKFDLGLCFDEDIFRIYQAWLIYNENEELAEKMEKVVPEEHWAPIDVTAWEKESRQDSMPEKEDVQFRAEFAEDEMNVSEED